jgi:hypothetical protein
MVRNDMNDFIASGKFLKIKVNNLQLTIH